MAKDATQGGDTTPTGVDAKILGQRQMGVPTAGGAFPTPRRGRKPLIDLAEIDRQAGVTNAAIEAGRAEKEAERKDKQEAADMRFLDSSHPAKLAEKEACEKSDASIPDPPGPEANANEAQEPDPIASKPDQDWPDEPAKAGPLKPETKPETKAASPRRKRATRKTTKK